MDDVAIKVENVSKKFRLPHEKQTSLKGLFLSSFRRKSYEVQHALRDVSFEVKKGEFFGIVGRNGSGKSTLLKTIAGVYYPSRGKIKINGSLVPFIELGVGFNPELTGRDNVFLNGALIGFSRKQMEVMYDDIVEFAELEPFMDQKLKNYSSGMQVRLAFSIAIRAKADVLLLDEVLAVGDALFKQKCFNHFYQLKKNKQTVLFVSHDVNALRQYCTSGILLEQGEIVASGPIDDIVNGYIDILSGEEAKGLEAKEKKEQEKPPEEREQEKVKETRHGSGKVLIKSISMRNAAGKTKKLLDDTDDQLFVELVCEAQEAVETPVYGMTVRDVAGNRIFASNNIWLVQKSHNLKQGDVQRVVWSVPNVFSTGDYTISPAVADMSGNEVYDSIDDMLNFKVRKKLYSSALINASHSMKIERVDS
jgi:ABC-2 type transport system ATP-binding protein